MKSIVIVGKIFIIFSFSFCRTVLHSFSNRLQYIILDAVATSGLVDYVILLKYQLIVIVNICTVNVSECICKFADTCGAVWCKIESCRKKEKRKKDLYRNGLLCYAYKNRSAVVLRRWKSKHLISKNVFKIKQ